MLTEQESGRLAELREIMGGHFVKLKKEEKIEYKDLLAKEKGEEIIHAEPIPEIELPEAPADNYESNLQKLRNAWGAMMDADDKGRLMPLFDDKNLLSGDPDNVYNLAFTVARDGGSRACLRRQFGKM
jgi:hypothetical protein